MANITVTHTFTNGTTADGTEVNTNFTDIINGTSDGTKDFSISALTVAGVAAFNANVTLGNATSDTITPTGRFAGDLDPSADNARDVGATALRFKAIHSYDFYASEGAQATPSYSFNRAGTLDTDTGLYSDAANTIQIGCGNTEIIEFDATSIDATVPITSSGLVTGSALTATTGDVTAASGDIVSQAGTKTNASHTFSGDPDTGMFSDTANQIQFTAGDTEILELDSSEATFTVAVASSAGISGTTGTFTSTFSADGAATFNDSGAAVDFRVEGDTKTHLLFVDGSADFIGMYGTTAPGAPLHVATDQTAGTPAFSSEQVAVFQNTATTGTGMAINLISGSSASAAIGFGDESSKNAGIIAYDNSANSMKFQTGGSATLAVTIDSSQDIQFNGTNYQSSGALSTDASGNVTTASDARLKDIIGKSKAGLKEVLKLYGSVWKWNEKSGYETEHEYEGFTTQSVEPYVPNAVGHRGDGMGTLQPAAILPAFAQSFRDMVDLIEGMGRKISALEAKVA
jgi:hypothetical protein